MPDSNLYARSIALVCLLTGAAAAQDFATRFADIRDRATPAQLYSFLQTLPKGGDLHHHATLSFYAHHVLEAAINAQKLGYRYYTRTSFHPCGDNENGPVLIYQNIGATALAKLPACRQTDFTPIDSINDEQKKAWLSAHILDDPGEKIGRAHV